MGSFFLPNWSPPDDPARPCRPKAGHGLVMMMMMNDENDDGYDVDDEGLEKGLRQGSQAEQSSNHTKLLCNAHKCTIAQMCTWTMGH